MKTKDFIALLQRTCELSPESLEQEIVFKDADINIHYVKGFTVGTEFSVLFTNVNWNGRITTNIPVPEL